MCVDVPLYYAAWSQECQASSRSNDSRYYSAESLANLPNQVDSVHVREQPYAATYVCKYVCCVLVVEKLIADRRVNFKQNACRSHSC